MTNDYRDYVFLILVDSFFTEHVDNLPDIVDNREFLNGL